MKRNPTWLWLYMQHWFNPSVAAFTIPGVIYQVIWITLDRHMVKPIQLVVKSLQTSSWIPFVHHLKTSSWLPECSSVSPLFTMGPQDWSGWQETKIKPSFNHLNWKMLYRKMAGFQRNVTFLLWLWVSTFHLAIAFQQIILCILRTLHRAAYLEMPGFLEKLSSLTLS
jgi:hypothetical protein